MKRSLVLPMFAVAACDLVSVDCTTDVRAAIEVVVLDSVTGGAVEAWEARAEDGAYTDARRSPEDVPFDEPAQLAYEREGTYAVEVSAAGRRSVPSAP